MSVNGRLWQDLVTRFRKSSIRMQVEVEASNGWRSH